MPSDTIYGFLFLPTLEKKVREIKKRDDKPFLSLIADFTDLKKLNIDFSLYSDLLSKNWPGPFTFLLNNALGIKTGVRLPEWKVLQKIIKECNAPLMSTSVNYSGEPAINVPEEIINKFGDQTNLMIFDNAFIPQASSAIIDYDGKDYQIVREGNKKLQC
jgi:L-threonylcarbamoyladenylate synthase